MLKNRPAKGARARVRARHERPDARPRRHLPLRGARHLPADGRARRARRRQEGPLGVGAQRAPGQPLPRRADGERDQGGDRQRDSSCRAGAPDNHGKKPPSGRLYFQTRRLSAGLPDTLPGHGHGIDNALLGHTLALQKELPGTRVTLVSKDINLRIKAAILGVHAEDYYNDKTIEDADLLFTGIAALPADFWETHGNNVESWHEQARTFYRVRGPLVARMAPEPVPLRRERPTASRRSCARSTARSRRSS